MSLVRSIRLRLAVLLRNVLFLERGTLAASGLATTVLRAVPAEAGCDSAASSGGGVQVCWPPVDLLVMQDVHLVGFRCAPLDRRRRLVTEHTGGTRETLNSHAQSLDIWSLIACSFLIRPRRLDAVFSLISPYVFNYYHWLLDCLPRLIAFEALPCEAVDRPAILVPPELAHWQIRSLELMGYPPGTYIEQDSPHILAKNYYLSSWHKGVDRQTVPSPRILGWLRQRLGATIQSECLQPVRKLFVDRSRARRPIANSQELSLLFTQRGFTSVRLEELSLDDQIRLFSGASVVAGLHGAGFANLVFSESPCLFEIYSTGCALPYYRELVEVLSGSYGCYLENSPAQKGLPCLTLSKVEAALDSFLERVQEST